MLSADLQEGLTQRHRAAVGCQASCFQSQLCPLSVRPWAASGTFPALMSRLYNGDNSNLYLTELRGGNDFAHAHTRDTVGVILSGPAQLLEEEGTLRVGTVTARSRCCPTATFCSCPLPSLQSLRI